MTFVSPPLETVKQRDERRTDNENDDISFSLSVRRSSVCFTVSNGEKQTSCYHSHCLYAVRLYVLLFLMGEKQTAYRQ
jgi:hypothetical protein